MILIYFVCVTPAVATLLDDVMVTAHIASVPAFTVVAYTVFHFLDADPNNLLVFVDGVILPVVMLPIEVTVDDIELHGIFGQVFQGF